MDATLLPSVVLLPVSLYLLRGCPVCWAIGVLETLAMHVHRRATEGDPNDASQVWQA